MLSTTWHLVFMPHESIRARTIHHMSTFFSCTEDDTSEDFEEAAGSLQVLCIGFTTSVASVLSLCLDSTETG